MKRPSVEVGPQGPTLTDDEALLEAMRNLWPILSPAGRRDAIETAKRINR